MKSASLCYLIHQGDSELSQIDKQLMSRWLSELPLLKQSSVMRCVNFGDRMASLLASRLLIRCAKRAGIDNFQLSEVQYPDQGKPCWQSEAGHFFDFNITHTDNLIVVAASKTMKVGVDAEKIRELKNLNFKMVLSRDELAEIQQSPEQFFDLWSKKEAVVKAANTRGIGRMRDVQLKTGYAVLDDINWYLSSIELERQLLNQYAICLATSMPDANVVLKQYYLSDLISL